MSHFSVAVIMRENENFKDVLIPFCNTFCIDYFELGGCFNNTLRLKNGEYINTAKISDLDLERDEEAYEKAYRFWEVIIEDCESNPGENFFNLYKKDYYINKYKDKETYADCMSRLLPFAYIMNDEWFLQGEIDLFDANKGNSVIHFVNNFRDTLDKNKDLHIAIVDCHI